MTSNISHSYHVPISGITWSQFMNDCGTKAYNKDRMKTFRNFDFVYAGKGVSWEGFVV